MESGHSPFTTHDFLGVFAGFIIVCICTNWNSFLCWLLSVGIGAGVGYVSNFRAFFKDIVDSSDRSQPRSSNLVLELENDSEIVSSKSARSSVPGSKARRVHSHRAHS